MAETHSAPRKKEEAVCDEQTASVYVGDDLLSHALSRAVQSARRVLTFVTRLSAACCSCISIGSGKVVLNPGAVKIEDSVEDREKLGTTWVQLLPKTMHIGPN